MSRLPRSATAFAPGGVGNVGPGLDILGLALAGRGDTVRAEWTAQQGIRIVEAGHRDLPTDATRHTAGLAAMAVVERAGKHQWPEAGISITVEKGLPLSGGQGGSAASAVAAAVAVNALLGNPLYQLDLVGACVEAEEGVSGRHADNIVASLFGGIVLIRSLEPLDLVQLPVPNELHVVIARPDQQLRTSQSRSVLPDVVPLDVALHQAAQVGAMVAALASGDLALLGRAIDDRIAEPARADLLPGFREAKRAALAAGALGSSISGGGPTCFALVQGVESGERVAAAMAEAYRECGYGCDVRVAQIDREGARVVEQSQRAEA